MQGCIKNSIFISIPISMSINSNTLPYSDHLCYLKGFCVLCVHVFLDSDSVNRSKTDIKLLMKATSKECQLTSLDLDKH